MTALDYALPPGPRTSVPFRLSIMMLLQYAVWGIWLPYIASYLSAPILEGGLGFTGGQIGWILGLAASIGAVSAPFIAGQVADRYLNAERALALLLLIGGGLNLLLAQMHSFGGFLLVSVAYSIVYMPTLSLSNSIAFQNLDDSEKQFPQVRLWGTIGWVVASISFTWIWLNTNDPVANTRRIDDALVLSGVLSVIYAVYAFLALPQTPPKADASHPLAFLKAFALLRNPTFLLVTLVALPVAMIHQVYFFRGAPFFEAVVGVRKAYLGWVLGIGQASEISFLLVLGYVIKRFGYKWVLVIGCLGYAARFGIFAIGQPAPLVIASQALHGLCYGCFFAGSFLLVEKLADEDIRHSAQTVFGIIILGLGPIMAGVYNQFVLGQFDAPTVRYAPIWAIQSGIALAAMLVLIALFRYQPSGPGHDPTAATHHGQRLS